VLTQLLQRCSYPNCSVLTMGTLCIRHELPVMREFVRGRPWSPPLLASDAITALGSLGERITPAVPALSSAAGPRA
jgi:hypothetical protein